MQALFYWARLKPCFRTQLRKRGFNSHFLETRFQPRLMQDKSNTRARLKPCFQTPHGNEVSTSSDAGKSNTRARLKPCFRGRWTKPCFRTHHGNEVSTSSDAGQVKHKGKVKTLLPNTPRKRGFNLV